MYKYLNQNKLLDNFCLTLLTLTQDNTYLEQYITILKPNKLKQYNGNISVLNQNNNNIKP